MVSAVGTTSSAVAGTTSTTSAAASKGNENGSSSGAHTVSAKVRKMIQSIKEIVGNDFSDTEVYLVLKENNMDPNETTQKLLNQDPFHEVKRRNRKKEPQSLGYSNSVDSENFSQGREVRTVSDRSVKHGGDYTRTALPGNGGMSREFRVVRDNRLTQSSSKDPNSALSPSGPGAPGAFEKGSAETSGISKLPGAKSYSQTSRVPNDVQPRLTKNTHLGVAERKTRIDGRRTVIPNAASRVQNVRPSSSKQYSATLSSSNSVVGVYSSSTDPVHVPSPDSRPSAAVGAIKRDVGVVGGRRQSSESGRKDSSTSPNSLSGSVSGRDHSLTESVRPFTVAKSDEAGQTGANESSYVNRPFVTRQHSGKPYQVVGHQKASLHNKEWKPKSSQKSIATSFGVIGTMPKTTSASAYNSKDLDPAGVDLQDKLSRVDIYENQNVIIAQHIRVPETDKVKLTFGSFGMQVDASRSVASGFQVAGDIEEPNDESVPSSSASPLDASSDDTSASKQVEMLDDQVMNSESDSPVVSDNQVPDKSSNPPNLDNYTDIGLVQDNGLFYDRSESHQQQDSPELQNFSAYDPQAGYDIPYFRPVMDGTIRGQGLPSPPEAVNPHPASNNPASTISMVQQQQQLAMAQMYPQVHVSHYPNLMQYRQFISPMYVPQMPMPGYSSNPGYPHPSNGNNYLLMPGGSSHVSANGLKYGIQQFKPVPGGSPTGYGNFSSPTGYAINGPGVVGNGTGLEDSSRIKYKDGSLYVPNPQAETSEIWVQNPRDIPGLQSSTYYNMPAQTPHAAYLQSHTGHASFNAAAQSSHMQFSGLYPAPQASAMVNPHHLGAVMGGNVGVAPTAAQAQVGAYQQPQLGHLNWTANF